jgi:MFS family permease
MTAQDIAVEDLPDRPATPLPRLVAAMFSSNAGTFIGLLTPLQLLLTLQTSRIAGADAAVAFGFITGVGALFALVAHPLAGRISDRTAWRFGRRRSWILTGAIGGALALIGFAFTTEIWQVAVIWCATQTLFNFQSAAAAALLADQVPKYRRGTVSGLVGLAAAVGPLAGIIAVSSLTDPVAQWGTIAIVSLVLGLLAVVLLRDPQHRPSPGQEGLNLKQLALSFWLNPRKHPAFGWAWAVRFLLTCVYASGTYNAFFLMERFEVSPEDVGGNVALFGIITLGFLAVTTVVVGPLSDRIRRQKPFVIGAGILGAAGLVLQGFAPSIPVVYVAIAILGIGTGMFAAIDTALCVRMLPSAENAGKDLAIINMANTLPQSFVPFIAPLLLTLGGFSTLYVALAVLALVGAALVLRLPELGREGDPRWAQITRPAPEPAPTTV